jgi:hypothetical protein
MRPTAVSIVLFSILFTGGPALAEDEPFVLASWLRQQVTPRCCPPQDSLGWPPSVLPPQYPPSQYPNPQYLNPLYPNPGTGTPGTPTTPNTSTPPVPGANPAANPAANPDQLTTPFATQTGGGGLQGRSFNETFDGDFGGVFYSKTIVTGYQTQTVLTSTKTVRIPILIDGKIYGYRTSVTQVYGTVTTPETRVVHVPVSGNYAGIMITDNDSPRPTDRAYFGYNYYNNFGAALNPGLSNVNLQRQMFGFEKTFLSGNASVGLRLPFVELGGPAGVASQSVGDLSILVKYAFINNPQTGNILSTGLIVTTPTSQSGGYLSDGSVVPHSVLLQPWVGFVRMFDRGYIQGISDLIVPTDSRDVTLLTNSLAAGYFLWRDPGSRWLTGIIPMAEVYVHTPLNDRNSNGLIYLQDQVNMTTGVHFRFPRATLSGAVSVPVVGPRPYSIEAIANLNFWF